MNPRHGHRCLLGAAALLLAACADPASLALTGANAVTVVDSGKTVTDHIMSFATGDECTIRHSLRGQAWCQPKRYDHGTADGGETCYRSIADVTCYAAENPYETPSRRATY